MLPSLYEVNKANSTDDTNKTLSDSLKKNSLLSRDAFLKLFIEQLKNQDPLNPMKNYELSAQLAQFSQLEQLYDINKNFNTFTSSLNRSTYFQGINLIGKNIEYEGDEVLKKGDSPLNLKFYLEEDATKVNVNIYDENDNLVRSIELDDLTKGENFATWDCKDINGELVPDGIYKFEVIAYNIEGDRVGYTTYGSGQITSLRFDPATKGALFKVNNEEITIDKILSISTSNTESDINNISNSTDDSNNTESSSDQSTSENN